MAFKIDRDIPPPQRNAPAGPSGPMGGRPMEYPWPQMQPGDSVFFPGKVVTPSGSLGRWRRKHPEQRFTTRREDGGLRIWRVE